MASNSQKWQSQFAFKLIIRLRKIKKLTQRELAKKVSTTQSVIARLESGSDSRIPSLDTLSRIASATHTKINIIFEDNGAPS